MKATYHVILVLAICLVEKMAAAKPVMPDYASGNLEREAGKAAVKLAANKIGEKKVVEKLPEVVQAATTVSVYDGSGDVDRALRWGGYAGTATKAIVKGKKLWDTGQQIHALGGAVADFQTKGLEEGSIAAYDRLSKVDSAKPWLKVGEFAGGLVAAGVWNVKKAFAEKKPFEDPRLNAFNPAGLKRAQGCNACKCKHETADLKPQIWQNGLDDGYSIVVLCAECKGVKYSQDVSGRKKAKREICSCASPDVFFAGVCRKKIGVLDKLWAQHYCRKCGGFRRGDLMELRKTDKGIAVYPAGVVPSDWDGRVYEQSELDAHVKSMVK